MLLHTTLSFAVYQDESNHNNCGEQRNCEHVADAPDQRIGTSLSKRTQPTQEAGTQPLTKAGILALTQRRDLRNRDCHR